MKVNVTIDNVNPAISYLPARRWEESKQTDPQWTQYYLGTYTMTSRAGANATFSFWGTGIWLYGAFRSNHGMYNITLDDVTTSYDGFGAGDGFYQQVLFGASDLTLGPHTITLTNDRNSSAFANRDLDFIVFEEEIGEDDDIITSQTDDDTSAQFTYGPAVTAWNTVPTNPTQYHGQTGHTTVAPGAFVSYTFTGSAVSIYGALGPSQGPYSVSVDGGTETNYTALNAEFMPQQLLFHNFFMGNTSHTITITNRPARAGQALDIDYAVADFVQAPIITTTSTSTTSTSASSTSIDTSTDLPSETSAEPEPTSNGIGTGAVIAIVVGVFALMALLSFALMMYRRRKKSKKDEDEPDMITVYPEPYGGGRGRYIPPSRNMQEGYNPLQSEGPTPLYPPSRGPFDQQPFPSNGPQHVDGASLFSGYAPGPPRQVTGRPRLDSSSTGHGLTEVASTVPYGHESAYTGISDGSSRIPAHGHSAVGNTGYNSPLPPIPPLLADQSRTSNSPLGLHQVPPPRVGVIPPTKGQVALPPSAHPEQRTEFINTSPEELAARRMRVEGREQDFGPLMAADGQDPLNVASLPPDYNQATETFRR